MMGGIDQQVQQSITSAKGNPQALQQKYQQSKQLIDLLAMQKLKSEKDAAAKEMQMQQQQNPQTIVEQREAELLGHNKQELMAQMGPTMNRKGDEMNAAMNRPPAGGMPPPAGGMRPPAQSGIAPTAPQARGMARGGIVSYASGGTVNTGAELEAEIMKFLQQGARPRDLENLYKDRPEALAIIRKIAPMPTQGPPTPMGAEFDPSPKVAALKAGVPPASEAYKSMKGPWPTPKTTAAPVPAPVPALEEIALSGNKKFPPRPAPQQVAQAASSMGKPAAESLEVPQRAPTIDQGISQLIQSKGDTPKVRPTPTGSGMPSASVNALEGATSRVKKGLAGLKASDIKGPARDVLSGASHEFSDYAADAEAEIADAYKRKGVGAAVGQAARSGIGGIIPLAKDAYTNLGIEPIVESGGAALQQLFTGNSANRPTPEAAAKPAPAVNPLARELAEPDLTMPQKQATGIATQVPQTPRVPQGPQTPSFQNTVKQRLSDRSDPARAKAREAAARAQRTDDDAFTKTKHAAEAQEREKMQAHYDRMNDPEYQRKKRLQAFLAGGAGRNSSAAGGAAAAHYNAREEMDKAEEAGIKQIYNMRKQESANAGTMANNLYTAGDTAYTTTDEQAGKALDTSSRVMLQEAIDRQNALEAGAQDDYKQGIAIRANMELLTEAQAMKDQWLTSHYPKDYMKYKKNLESAMREGKPEKYKQAKAKLAAMEASVPASIQNQISILTQLVERGRANLLGNKVQAPAPAPSGKIKPGTLKRVS